MAAAIVADKGAGGLPRAMLARLGLSIFFTMNVMAFTMALWTADVYGAGEASHTSGVDLERALSLPGGALLAAGPVLAGFTAFRRAPGAGCKHGVLSTDWLLATGVGRFLRLFISVGVSRSRTDLFRGRLRDPGHDDLGTMARGHRQIESGCSA